MTPKQMKALHTYEIKLRIHSDETIECAASQRQGLDDNFAEQVAIHHTVNAPDIYQALASIKSRMELALPLFNKPGD